MKNKRGFKYIFGCFRRENAYKPNSARSACFFRRRCESSIKGFTIIEVIVATFVLAAGLLPVIALTSKSITTATASRDTVIATGLAQEGIELVRNVRDNNLAKDYPAFKDFPSVNVKNCSVSIPSPSPSPSYSYSGEIGLSTCDSDNNSKMLKLFNDGFYRSSNGSFQKFQRKIMYEYLNSSGYITDNPSSAKRVNFMSVVAWGWSGRDFQGGSFDTFDEVRSECTIAKNCLYIEDVLTSRQ